MKREYIEQCEMGKISREILATEQPAPGKSEFIEFLRFCVDGLNKGGSVQEVWSDFLEKAQ